MTRPSPRNATRRPIERATVIHAAVMLLASLASIFLGHGAPLAAVGPALFGMWLVLAWWSGLIPPGSGPANLVTTIRLLLTAMLPLGGYSGLVVAALVMLIFTLDGIDGWLAHRNNAKSDFGAAFDMEVDAMLVMVISLMLWQRDIAGPWVLTAGLWRYGYALGVRLIPTRGEAPRSRLARYIFAILLISFTLAFLLPLPWATWSVAVGTVFVSYSFMRSIYWSLFGPVREA